MSENVKTFLNEKYIYVSWGILVALLWIAYSTGQTMLKVEQLAPIVQQVGDLKTDVAVLKTDVSGLKNTLHFYDIEIKK